MRYSDVVGNTKIHGMVMVIADGVEPGHRYGDRVEVMG